MGPIQIWVSDDVDMFEEGSRYTAASNNHSVCITEADIYEEKMYMQQAEVIIMCLKDVRGRYLRIQQVGPGRKFALREIIARTYEKEFLGNFLLTDPRQPTPNRTLKTAVQYENRVAVTCSERFSGTTPHTVEKELECIRRDSFPTFQDQAA